MARLLYSMLLAPNAAFAYNFTPAITACTPFFGSSKIFSRLAFAFSLAASAVAAVRRFLHVLFLLTA